MSFRSRDLLALGVAALLARIVAVVVLPWPAFTDPAYYSLIAQRLAEGHGFSAPVLYSFLEVGSRIPEPAVLPVPSNAHWMPLTSVVAAASMAFFGPTYVAGTVPLAILSALLPPMTYIVTTELGGTRAAALVAGVLAIFAGPLLIMYPTTDNFAVFGSTGAASLYCSMRAIRAPRAGPWLVAAGAFAGLATLARIDGALLTLGVATAWFVRRGWTPWKEPVSGGATLVWGAASALAFLAVMAPWLARNLVTFGAMLPSTGGHTLWIRSYNEQFSIGHEVSLSTYLDWGLANIAGSKLQSWAEIAGRTAVLLGGTFVLPFVPGLWRFRRRADLAPFYVYFIAMFFAMGALFTFHGPKGAFYHSSPAWLPWAFGIAVLSVAPLCVGASRYWKFLRRPATHRFILASGLAGAIVLSIVGSATLYKQWDRSRVRDQQAAAFLRTHALRTDVLMASDPASIYPLSGNPGIAAPFDPYRVTEKVVDAYDVEWVIVLRPGPGEVDPLGLWDGASATDSEGNHPSFMPAEPAFEVDDLRIFRVVDG
jgi:4-amino-4-deoxy-L-arabinose transferase-like glycosyltransferase